jgi:predicted phosphodiesterase
VRTASHAVPDSVGAIIVFSDLHAHALPLPQLAAAMAGIDANALLVFNGDLFHGGPAPVEAFEWVTSRVGELFVAGNHDENMLRMADEPAAPPSTEAGAYQRLTAAQRGYIASRPHRLELSWRGHRIALMHGHLTPDGQPGSWRASPAEQATAFFDPAFSLCVTSHTHCASIDRRPDGIMANTGSTSAPILCSQLDGEPTPRRQSGDATATDDDPRPSFLAISSEHGQIDAEIVRFDYDRPAAVAALAAAGEPRMTFYTRLLLDGFVSF